MRLTNYIRDAFIEAAMQDVPSKVNHTEEIRKLAQTDILSRLPKDILKIWTENKESRSFLIIKHDDVRSVSFVYPSVGEYSSGRRPLSEEVKAKIDVLADEMVANNKVMKELRGKLKGAAYACTTTKQLRELLPEFESYLPAEVEQSARSLPVVANIVSEFTKAGWPAKKKEGKK